MKSFSTTFFLGYKNNSNNRKNERKKSDSDWLIQSVARREPSCTRICFLFFSGFVFLTPFFYDDDLISEKTLIWVAVGVNTIRRAENLSGSKSF